MKTSLAGLLRSRFPWLVALPAPQPRTDEGWPLKIAPVATPAATDSGAAPARSSSRGRAPQLDRAPRRAATLRFSERTRDGWSAAATSRPAPTGS